MFYFKSTSLRTFCQVLSLELFANKTCDRKAGSDIFDKASHGVNKWGDRQYIQDEGAGSEQGSHKDKEVDEGKQEDKESGKQANFYFRGLTPFLAAGL